MRKEKAAAAAPPSSMKSLFQPRVTITLHDGSTTVAIAQARIVGHGAGQVLIPILIEGRLAVTFSRDDARRFAQALLHEVGE